MPSIRSSSSVVVLSFLLALAVPAPAQEPVKTLEQHAVAPDFVSRDAAGREVRLADFRDKVVVLDFWATWCNPCIRSLPHVQEIAKAHASDGVVVLAVCTSDSQKKFDAWVAEHASEYPDVIFTCDPHDRGSDTFDDRASQKLYGVTGLPTKFVVGRDGKIALTMVGLEDEDLRLEAGLARAGIAIDGDTAKGGEAQIEKGRREAVARAAEAAARPRPNFFPLFGSLKAGDAMPEFTLVDADGKELTMASLRGKPLVIGMSWAEIAPRTNLQEIHETFGSYGVQTVGMLVFTSGEEFTEWSKENGARIGYRAAMDPAGKFEGDPKDFQARIKFNETTVVHRFFTGNMLPGMPVAIVADADGKLVGSFSFGPGWRDGLANLLLHAGVKLKPEHMPETVAPPEAFEPPAPRAAEAPVKPIDMGVDAPDFTSQDLAGNDVNLADYRGKVVVLDFWATWCGPCKISLPHVQDVAARYKAQGLVIVASCTSDEREKFDAWVKENQMSYPDILFTHDAAERKPERASRRLYGVSGIPAQFIIGRDGKLVAKVSGYRAGEMLLEGALAKAGIEIEPEVLEKAVADQKAREESEKKTAPAARMVPMQPRK